MIFRVCELFVSMFFIEVVSFCQIHRLILKRFVSLYSIKAFFSTMQNKTDKGASLVSKSLPVVNSNSVCRLFSVRNRKYYV